MPLTPGSRLGPYAIVGPLGTGGMGEVYRARDTRLGRDVALKVLPAEVAADPERRDRFLREARAAATLAHPHVATLYDIGEAEGRLYLAMEVVEGETLAARPRGRLLAITEILEIAAQVADALDEAHRRGVVHRDIKPANVMVDTRGRAKVLDFGLARVMQSTSPEGRTATALATTPGLVMGTLAYMSPEQVLGQEVDARSDLFSLGALLYELTTGAPAFAADTPTAIAERIVHAQPDAIARFNYDAPPELDRIIRKCLEKDRGRRYQSAQELVVDVRNLQRDMTGPDRPAIVSAPAVPARRRMPRAVGISVLAIAAALAAIGIWMWRGRAPAAGVPRAPDTVQSIAVLPFVNMTERPENEYLGDGLAEEVINHLAKGGRLRVVARTSAFSFKGKNLDVREIGQRLNVEAVLEGSVRQAGSRLRVTAQIIDTANGYHLWSDTFDREASDILAIQDEISSAIAARLSPSSGRTAAAAPPRTTSAEAYDHYLRGLHAMGPWEGKGLEQAEAHFDAAVKLDPEFSVAWAALAEAVIMRHEMYAVRTRDDAYARAGDAARRALAAPMPAAEGHAALAHILIHDLKWQAAEVEAGRATELNPGSALSHEWYGYVLHCTGRLGEAEREHRRALELDPLSGPYAGTLAMTFLAAGRWEDARQQARRAVELGDRWSAITETTALVELGRIDEALASAERVRGGDVPEFVVDQTRAYVLASSGRGPEARQLLAEAERAWKSGPEGQQVIAIGGFIEGYAALRDAERLFAWLRPADAKAIEYFTYIGQYSPRMRAFASDPRVEAMYRASGLKT